MLLKHLFIQLPATVLYIVLVIAAPIVAAEAGYRSASMIDSAVNGDIDAVLSVIFILFVFYLVHGLLLYWIKVTKALIIRNVRVRLKSDMLSGIFGGSASSLSFQSSGEYIAAFSNDISILEYRYYESLLDIVHSVSTVVTYMAAVASLHQTFALIIVSGEVITLVVCFVLKGISVKRSRKYIEALSGFTQQLKEFFTAFRSIKHYAAEKEIYRQFSKHNQALERDKANSELVINFVNMFARFINCMNAYIIVGAGVVLIIHGELTVGLMLTAYNFTNSLATPMRNIVYKINDIQSVKSISEKINGIIRENRVEKKRDASLAQDFDGIEFSDVDLKIGDNEILSGINYRFEPRKKYLIIGQNGSGKSSLLRLMKKGFSDYGGTIRICGKELREVSDLAISSRVSYINETVSLFSDTVYNNISLYRDIPQEEIDNAAETAFMKLPYDKRISGEGNEISSGEKRRIELARCILFGSDVIILDEAVSTLDIKTAFEIEKTMLDLENKTVIFVSHNFSNEHIERYDSIILMDKGKITASGKHKELIKSSSEYRRLMSIKSLSL